MINEIIQKCKNNKELSNVKHHLRSFMLNERNVIERGVEYLHVLRIFIEVGLPYIGDYGSQQQLPLVRSPRLNTLACRGSTVTE